MNKHNQVYPKVIEQIHQTIVNQYSRKLKINGGTSGLNYVGADVVQLRIRFKYTRKNIRIRMSVDPSKKDIVVSLQVRTNDIIEHINEIYMVVQTFTYDSEQKLMSGLQDIIEWATTKDASTTPTVVKPNLEPITNEPNSRKDVLYYGIITGIEDGDTEETIKLRLVNTAGKFTSVVKLSGSKDMYRPGKILLLNYRGMFRLMRPDLVQAHVNVTKEIQNVIDQTRSERADLKDQSSC